MTNELLTYTLSTVVLFSLILVLPTILDPAFWKHGGIIKSYLCLKKAFRKSLPILVAIIILSVITGLYFELLIGYAFILLVGYINEIALAVSAWIKRTTPNVKKKVKKIRKKIRRKK